MGKVTIPENGTKIVMDNDKLQVPSHPIIPFIIGDGIGPDIWHASVRVFDAAVEKAYKGSRQVEWMEVYAGEKSNEVYGENTWLPQETLDMIDEYLIAIKGPLTTPVGGGIRSINVALRQKLDLYVCQRPVRWFAGVPSPVKDPSSIDMVIFRENTEDIYAGIEFERGSDENANFLRYLESNFPEKYAKIRFPNSVGLGIKPISEEGTSRLVSSAIEFAIANNRKSVTLVHKGNIMKFTEGSFKNWGYELAEKKYGSNVFTWAQYDRILDSDGIEAANNAQREAEKED